MAKKEHKSEFVGMGSLVQLGGVVAAIIFFPIGIIPGIIMLIIGNKMSNSTVCSECRQKVDTKAKLCPHCSSQF